MERECINYLSYNEALEKEVNFLRTQLQQAESQVHQERSSLQLLLKTHAEELAKNKEHHRKIVSSNLFSPVGSRIFWIIIVFIIYSTVSTGIWLHFKLVYIGLIHPASSQSPSLCGLYCDLRLWGFMPHLGSGFYWSLWQCYIWAWGDAVVSKISLGECCFSLGSLSLWILLGHSCSLYVILSPWFLRHWQRLSAMN